MIYLMIVDKTEKINTLYKRISEDDIGSLLKILCYPSDDYKGYSYIKIYNENASKENMLQSLADNIGIGEIITVKAPGNKSGGNDLNSIAREVKKQFEPLVTFKKKP